MRQTVSNRSQYPISGIGKGIVVKLDVHAELTAYSVALSIIEITSDGSQAGITLAFSNTRYNQHYMHMRQ